MPPMHASRTALVIKFWHGFIGLRLLEPESSINTGYKYQGYLQVMRTKIDIVKLQVKLVRNW